MTSFYWYIDISESLSLDDSLEASFQGGTAWAAPTDFRVGPIIFEEYEMLSVNEFINRVQDAFNDAFEKGVASRQYSIEAKVRGMSGTFSALMGQGMTLQLRNEFTQAKDNRELAIEYKIDNEDSILFPSNPQLGGIHFTILMSNDTALSPPTAPDISLPQDAPSGVKELPSAEITVEQSSDFTGFEVPYCTVSSTVTDRPPVPPDMVFVPFVGVNNKVLIMLNSGQGEKLEKPIVLRDSDMAFVTAEYESQHELAITTEATAAGAASGDTLSSTLLKLEYKNDDPIKQYEIFRIDTKPELVGSSLYPNFRNFNLTEQPIQTKIGPNKASTAASYVDTIVPNKKYWYCARSRDVHQNISNPTYIFEVEMVDNKGQMFLISKPYTVAPRVPKYKKVGRRYMAIRPRMSQTLFDPTRQDGAGTLDIDGEPDSSILGQTGVDSIWQQIFKIRVTSKKTGRKIDLNVTFKNTGVVTP